MVQQMDKERFPISFRQDLYEWQVWYILSGLITDYQVIEQDDPTAIYMKLNMAQGAFASWNGKDVKLSNLELFVCIQRKKWLDIEGIGIGTTAYKNWNVQLLKVLYPHFVQVNRIESALIHSLVQQMLKEHITLFEQLYQEIIEEN